MLGRFFGSPCSVRDFGETDDGFGNRLCHLVDFYFVWFFFHKTISPTRVNAYVHVPIRSHVVRQSISVSPCIFLYAPEKLPPRRTVFVAVVGDIWSDADWETTTLKVLKEGSRLTPTHPPIEFRSPIAPPSPHVTLTRVQFLTRSNDPRRGVLARLTNLRVTGRIL